MPKKLIKKYMPDPELIRTHKHLKIFGSLLHNPFLWHFNRKSVSGAFAVGLFCAFVPIPFQMVLAAAIAIMVRVNLPLSVALVWISNPITMPPLFYAAYKFGAWILGEAPHDIEFALSWQWLTTELSLIWKPFLLGCFSAGVSCALISYSTIRILWGRHIKNEWKNRKHRYKTLSD
ncbi:MAG: DUF2062 domain-containing protein [Pseudomonadota bacterium]